MRETLVKAIRSYWSKYGFPTGLGLFFALIGTLPYVYGYWLADSEMRFMGFVGRGLFGRNGYLMLARQAQDGQFLLENLLTAETLPRVFMNLEWWLFGRTATWTGLSLIGVFHLSRVAIVFLFMFSVWYLVRQCLATSFQQKFATVLIACGSGCGWVAWCASRAVYFAYPPGRAWLSQQDFGGEVFYNMLGPVPADISGVSVPSYLVCDPHFIVAAAFAALMAGFLIRGAQTGQRRYYALSGLAGSAHILIRPYNIPEMYLMLFLFSVLLCVQRRRFELKRFIDHLVPGLIMLPFVAYYAWLNHVDAMGPSRPAYYPCSFLSHIPWLGISFVACLLSAGRIRMFKAAQPASLLLVLWFVIAYAIAQAHEFYSSGLEARFPAYMIVPPILATAGPFRSWWHAIKRSNWMQRLGLANSHSLAVGVAIAVIALSAPSGAIAYARMFNTLQERPVPYYVSNDTYQALEWLEQNAGTHDTVLSSFETGQLIPRVAGVRAFQGHYMLTINHARKSALAKRFFEERNDDAFKRQLAKEYGIRYVLAERPGEISATASHSWLKPRFAKGSAVVYEVVGE